MREGERERGSEGEGQTRGRDAIIFSSPDLFQVDTSLSILYT